MVCPTATRCSCRFADATNREYRVIRSALGGALARQCTGCWRLVQTAGGYKDIFAAEKKMGGLKDVVYRPNPANVKLYDQLYADYSTLYSYFGRGENDVMKRFAGNAP